MDVEITEVGKRLITNVKKIKRKGDELHIEHIGTSALNPRPRKMTEVIHVSVIIDLKIDEIV